MRRTHTCGWLWLVVVSVALAAAGIGFSQIQPSGRRADVIQFDVISELNMLTVEGPTYVNRVVFARYWVCQDYYAVCVIWAEPHVPVTNVGALIFFSDETGFHIDDEDSREFIPVNTTYPKPLGERGLSEVGTLLRSGPLCTAETRFAEAQALSRRVYVSDLEPVKNQKPGADGAIDVNVPRRPGGVTRELAHLKVRGKDDRIESMELFDDQRRPLGRMRYEYERDGKAPALVRLIADWPPRPVKLAVDVNEAGTPRSVIDYVSHKGGRTSTVTYRNVAIGDRVLRLPVQVEVRRSDDKRLVRSAKLMNFKELDLDKAGVWQAAKTFGSFSGEDHTLAGLVKKYLAAPPRRRKPLEVDPNDILLARRLLAKYPVPEVPVMPEELRPKVRRRHPPLDPDPETELQQARARLEAEKRERAQQQEQMRAWGKQTAKMLKPEQKTVEPDDARVIREWIAHYENMVLPPPLTEEEKATYYSQGWIRRTLHPTECEREVRDLCRKLQRILSYHRAPRPPDNKPTVVEPNDLDLKLIRQLQDHYGKLAVQQDQGLGGRLKALDALTRLDRILQGYSAFEGHTIRYLQMVRDAGLLTMHMVGGDKKIEKLVEAGQYDRADKLTAQWADKSAADNDADAIFRFTYGQARGPGLSWASVKLLDRFLKRPGLSPVQRYEALALRAIILDDVDRFLADPEAGGSEAGGVDRWILSTTTKAQISKLTQAAVVQAVSAWGALGPARSTIAKPYSTDNTPPNVVNMMEAPDATRLQETSAKLDRIVSRRFGRQGPPPRSRETQRPAPRR